MFGFVTIVKWLSGIPQKETCHTMERAIKSTSAHNKHFHNLGEPLNKFVYFDASLCEYNVIFLYPNGEEGVIAQFVDYLEQFDDDNFPLGLITSKYGPVTVYNVNFKPIDINTDLLTCLRTCQYLGYLKYMNREQFNAINISTKDDLIEYAKKYKIEDNWIFTKTPPDLERDVQIEIRNEKDFIFYISEKYGLGLNKSGRVGEHRSLKGGEWNYFHIVEEELKNSLLNAKNSNDFLEGRNINFRKLKT